MHFNKYVFVDSFSNTDNWFIIQLDISIQILNCSKDAVIIEGQPSIQEFSHKEFGSGVVGNNVSGKIRLIESLLLCLMTYKS